MAGVRKVKKMIEAFKEEIEMTVKQTKVAEIDSGEAAAIHRVCAIVAELKAIVDVDEFAHINLNPYSSTDLETVFLFLRDFWASFPGDIVIDEG